MTKLTHKNKLKHMVSRRTRKHRGGGIFLNFLLSLLATTILIVDSPEAKRILENPVFSSTALSTYEPPLAEGFTLPELTTGTSVNEDPRLLRNGLPGSVVPLNSVAGHRQSVANYIVMDLNMQLSKVFTPEQLKEIGKRIRNKVPGQDNIDIIMQFLKESGKVFVKSDGTLNMSRF
jgi:hypothetical protein